MKKATTMLATQQGLPKIKKPPVVGIYGVQGCGKSTLLNGLKDKLRGAGNSFKFFDSSDAIDKVVPHSVSIGLSPQEKTKYREQVIENIGQECTDTGAVGVVAGHYMFWYDEITKSSEMIWTEKNEDVYTHILYLDVPPSAIAEQREKDTSRTRPDISVEHLCKWQEVERNELRNLCIKTRILFSVISQYSESGITEPDCFLTKVTALLQDFRIHDEEYNLSLTQDAMDRIVDSYNQRLETMLVLDADQTLAPQDTGALFWNIAKSMSGDYLEYPLRKLFTTQGYSHHSFRQATLLYEELGADFDTICDQVVERVEMYPEFKALLQQAKEHQHIGAVVVTCGGRYIWEKVLANNGLAHVKVIGGTQIKDSYVITGSVKGALVDRLHEKKLYVWAFGDSSLDLEMLGKADQAIVVVGERGTMPRIMDEALDLAISAGLNARQALLLKTGQPRLTTELLPLVSLTDSQFIESVWQRQLVE